MPLPHPHARSGNAPTRRPSRAPQPAGVARTSTIDPVLTDKHADRAPTPYQREFAKWVVRRIGYKPSTAGSLNEAFLRGIVMAMAAGPDFRGSQDLADWREANGMNKPGRLKRDPQPAKRKPVRRVEEPDEFEGEMVYGDDAEDLEGGEWADDDFEENEEEDDDYEEDYEEEDEEPPAPVVSKPTRKPVRKPTVSKSAPVKRRQPTKAAPAPSKPRRAVASPKADADDFAF